MQLADIRTLADVEEVERKIALKDRGYPRTASQLLDRARVQFGGRTCLVEVPDAEHPEQHTRIDYATFVDRTRRLARWLDAAGIGRRDVVSIVSGTSIAAEVALWGAATAAVASPLNPYLAPSQLAALMREAGSRILVTEREIPGLEIWPKVRALLHQVPSLQAVLFIGPGPGDGLGDVPGNLRVLSFDEALAGHSAELLPAHRQPGPDDVAVLFHTGGTTGTPKLARQTHWNQASSCCLFGESMRWQPDDALLVGLPLFHVNAALLTGLAGFAAGSTIVLAGRAGFRTPNVVPQLWTLAQCFGISFVSAVPTVYIRWMQQPRPAGAVSLRYGLCGGAPLSRALMQRIESALGLAILEGYGLTEGTMVSALNPAAGERRAGSVGLRRPYQALRVVTLDAEGRITGDCAPGQVGEIVMRGHHVIPGYLRDSETARAFTPDGWLKTGDLARQDADGYLWIVGRSKDLIIRGGHNIEPGLIEEALLAHPAVQAVAAVGQIDADVGELPVAYVVARAGASPSEDELLAFARMQVPERAAVPVRFTLLGELPVTSVGKVDKQALRRDAAAAVVRSHLAQAGLHGGFSLEPGTELTLRVALPAEATDAEMARAKQALQALAVEVVRWKPPTDEPVRTH